MYIHGWFGLVGIVVLLGSHTDFVDQFGVFMTLQRFAVISFKIYILLLLYAFHSAILLPVALPGHALACVVDLQQLPQHTDKLLQCDQGELWHSNCCFY